jgi:hypothetical protein
LKSVRTPLGKVLARTLKSATYMKDPPNAPAGDYVIIQYDTSFENKKDAVEDGGSCSRQRRQVARLGLLHQVSQLCAARLAALAVFVTDLFMIFPCASGTAHLPAASNR